MSTFVQVVMKRPWKTQGKSKMTTPAVLATSEAHCPFLYPHDETKHASVPAVLENKRRKKPKRPPGRKDSYSPLHYAEMTEQRHSGVSRGSSETLFFIHVPQSKN